MRTLLILVVFLLTVTVKGQNSILSDTLRISEIVVKARSDSRTLPGFRTTVIDSGLLSEYSHENLSDIIAETSPVFIKSYGPGGIATTSFRGTGPGNTRLTWNNFDLNTPMPGQSDLSLIPAGFIDELNILYGNAAASEGKGSSGGNISIITKPDWNNRQNLMINLAAGSFGKLSGMAAFRAGNKDFQTVTRFFLQQAENNFRYLDDVSSGTPAYYRRQNAETEQKSMMQELYFRNSKSVTSAHFWYLSADRNLPTIILNSGQPAGENQMDESLRTIISHERYNSGKTYSISTAFLYDRLNYLNNLASINSENRSKRIVLNSSADLLHTAGSRVKINFDHSLTLVNSVNYGSQKIRNESSVSALASTVIKGNPAVFVVLKEILADNRFLIPDFSAGLDIRILPDRKAVLKMNYSRTTRLPSLNDLYWNPGGNLDLKNEYTYSGEVSVEIRNRKDSPVSLESEISVYSNRMMDLIQWIPGEFSYWTPVNMQKVNSTGVESMVNVNFVLGRTKFRLNGNYSFTNAVVAEEIGETAKDMPQLVYVPKNLFNAHFWIYFGDFHTVWSSSFTGLRYTTRDNSDFLPSYLLHNVTSGYRIETGSHSLDINLKVENMFNRDYQAVAYYPMPGRSFLFSLVYQLSK